VWGANLKHAHGCATTLRSRARSGDSLFSNMSAGSIPNLRLVGLGDQLEHSTWSQQQRARLEVVKENRIAAHGSAAAIDPRDPRWRLAMQTQAQLEGSVLAPERRDRLMQNARQLGLRPFEANLIIAIVQDKARQDLGHKAYAQHNASAAPMALKKPLSLPVQDEVPQASPRTGKAIAWECLRLGAALSASGLVAIALARWITLH